jgi:hypothetical protein
LYDQVEESQESEEHEEQKNDQFASVSNLQERADAIRENEIEFSVISAAPTESRKATVQLS